MNSCDRNHAEATPSPDAVLLVDDEPALLEIFAAILQRHFEVTSANNAQEAEAWLRRKTFKVILADHLMPKETGLDFLTRMRVEFPQVQRILATGNMTPEMMRVVGESNLLFAYLEKPLSITALVQVVQSAVAAHDNCLAAAK
jgi:two-component system response regulator HupR/HoxA